MLFPLSLDVPGSEALMVWVISCKMTILDNARLGVAARNEMDFLVKAHDRILGQYLGQVLLRCEYSTVTYCEGIQRYYEGVRCAACCEVTQLKLKNLFYLGFWSIVRS